MRTVIHVAVAENGVIGRQGELPWRLSGDLKRFKAATMGKPVIMGRKTFDSIGKPLPGRTNIVLSRARGLRIEGAQVAHNLDQALSMAGYAAQTLGAGEAIIAGGAEVFSQFMPIANRMEISHVDGFPQGDAYFPEIHRSTWKKNVYFIQKKDSDNEYNVEFSSYQRKI